MAHVVIVGGGAALARPVVEHYLKDGHEVTALCRSKGPGLVHPRLATVNGVDMATTGGGWLTGSAPIDVLVTMTGATHNARLEKMELADWETAIEGNLTTVFNALRFGLPRMTTGGNVVVVGSIVGSTGGYGCANYAAAKAGLVGLVRAAANEWASREVMVNLLELGYIDAGMGERLTLKVKEAVLPTIPLGRFGSVEDVVQAVDFLSKTRYMTGGVLTLAGGIHGHG